MNNIVFCEQEIKRTFEVYQNRLFEVRILPHSNLKYPVSGYFDNADDLINQIKNNHYESIPLFMTLNEIGSDAECIVNYNVFGKGNKAVSDKHILNYSYIHIDADPEKDDVHSQATEQESEYAKEKINQVYKYLTEQGFPEGIIAFSGNGYNLDYYTNFPNTKENKTIVKQFLDNLSRLFSDDKVKIDTTTYNPSRIIKLFGCVSAKGQNTPERPYRLTSIISVPEKRTEVTLQQLQDFNNNHTIVTETTTKAVRKSAKKSVSLNEITSDNDKQTAKISDVKNWLDYYKIAFKVKEDEYDGKSCTMYILETCPFTEHDNEYCSFICKFDNNNCYFKCHHDHCNHTIHDLLKKYPIVGQLPLIDGDDKKVKIFNEVASNCKLIISDDNKKYVVRNDTNKLLNFDNSDFDCFVTEKAQGLGEIISNPTVATIKNNFRTLFNKYAMRIPVANRVAFKDDTLYYAVSEDFTVAIRDNKIMKYKGNEMYFYYPEYFKEQCMPDLKSSASALPELVKQVFNIDDEYLLCFLAQLCTFFIPNINNPILVLNGGQGTSKSTTSKKIKSIVDPANLDVITMPDKEDGLFSVLLSSYLVAFDNVDKISSTFSDILCTNCTGGNAGKRKLYSDNDLIQIKLHTNVILNGIGEFVKKSDLAERCNTIYLEQIKVRLTERQVWKEFEAVKPKILGSIFNTLKVGLTLIDEMTAQIEKLPRMADFAIYGAAFIKAMGLDYKEFIAQYTHNTATLLGERADTDDFVILIKTFLNEHNGRWEGQSKALLAELNILASKKRLPIDKFVPNTLSRKLGNMQPSLTAAGVEFIKGRTGKRYIKLSLIDNTETENMSTKLSDFIDLEGEEIDLSETIMPDESLYFEEIA